MKFLEKDLEDIIWESDRDELRKRGLCLGGKITRQRRIGNYGIADLITFDRFSKQGDDDGFYQITVYELKKDKIGISAFLQAVRYSKGIDDYLRYRDVKTDYEIRIVLIGSEVDDSGSFIFLPDVLGTTYSDMEDKLTLMTYSYGVDGLNFRHHSRYSLLENGF